jgi:hypothetical protein
VDAKTASTEIQMSPKTISTSSPAAPQELLEIITPSRQQPLDASSSKKKPKKTYTTFRRDPPSEEEIAREYVTLLNMNGGMWYVRVLEEGEPLEEPIKVSDWISEYLAERQELEADDDYFREREELAVDQALLKFKGTSSSEQGERENLQREGGSGADGDDSSLKLVQCNIT